VLKRNPLADGTVLSVEADLWPAMQATVSHVFRCGLTTFAAAPPGGAMFELCMQAPLAPPPITPPPGTPLPAMPSHFARVPT
jgi:hypothetical protein